MEQNAAPIMTTTDFANRLEGIRGHVARADAWAEEHLRLFPNLAMVSINLGAAFMLEFSVTLTWRRDK